jgi:hypothetical protein
MTPEAETEAATASLRLQAGPVFASDTPSSFGRSGGAAALAQQNFCLADISQHGAVAVRFRHGRPYYQAAAPSGPLRRPDPPGAAAVPEPPAKHLAH